MPIECEEEEEEEEEVKVSSPEDLLGPAFQPSIRLLLDKNKRDVLQSSLKYLLSVFKNVERDAHNAKNRRFLEKIITTKKFVLDVVGAREFIEAFGFRLVTIQGKQWFDVEEQAVDPERLRHVIDWLESNIDSAAAVLKAPAVPGTGTFFFCVSFWLSFLFFPPFSSRSAVLWVCSEGGTKLIVFFCPVAPTSAPVSNKPRMLCAGECGFYG